MDVQYVFFWFLHLMKLKQVFLYASSADAPRLINERASAALEQSTIEL